MKGYPSDTYLRGPKAGKPKPTGSALQARHYLAGALLAGSIMRSERPEARVVLAFPNAPTYRALASRILPALMSMSIEVWLLDVSNSVEQLPHVPGDSS